MLDEALSVMEMKELDEIQIGFGLHDKTGNYSVWVGTAMQSIIENTSSRICFHILIDDTVNDANRNKLTQVAVSGGHKISFHLLDKELFSHLQEQVKRFTIGAMFRILLPEILPKFSKIIYLDADILVNRDIKDLWDIDINEYCMAAVPDMGTIRGHANPIPVIKNEVLRNQYFNSGVLYFNLDILRKYGNMKEKVLTYLESEKNSQFPDQDALNVIYNRNVLLLEEKWNYFARISQDNREKEIKRAIYHYASTKCILHTNLEIDKLYYETIGRTPWGREECRRLLDASLNRLGDRIIQLEKVLSYLTNPCIKRIFYGNESFAMKNLYQMINVQEGDYRILAEAWETSSGILSCRSLDALKKETDEYIVFVLPEADNGTSIQRLEQMGLVNEKDFFVIPRLLPPEKGGYI